MKYFNSRYYAALSPFRLLLGQKSVYKISYLCTCIYSDTGNRKQFVQGCGNNPTINPPISPHHTNVTDQFSHES